MRIFHNNANSNYFRCDEKMQDGVNIMKFDFLNKQMTYAVGIIPLMP
jgi:hypothetical protein